MHLNVGNQSNTTHELWAPIGCTCRCSPSTWCGGGGVVAQASRLVGAPKWACPGSRETHRQIQPAVRPVGFALQPSPFVATSFGGAGGMTPPGALGAPKVFGGAARPHTVLNGASFSAVQQCRLRWGAHLKVLGGGICHKGPPLGAAAHGSTGEGAPK
jgi:hypothetical protein